MRSTTIFSFFIWICFVKSNLVDNSLLPFSSLSEENVNEIDEATELKESRASTKNFPCPYEQDIYPCNCTVLDAGLELTCKNISSQNELENIFLKEFPIKTFNRFIVYDSPNLLGVGNIMNGISFEGVILQRNGISWLSDYFLYDSISTLGALIIRECDLVSETFPFFTIGSYTNLTQLTLDSNKMTWIPVLQSDSLEHLSITNEDISAVEPGTFERLPNIREINLQENNISVLQSNTFGDTLTNLESIDLKDNSLTIISAGAIHIPKMKHFDINLRFNTINEIEPNFLVLPELTVGLTISIKMDVNEMTQLQQAVFEPIWPYLTTLSISNNPLECGCDVAWLVLQPDLIDTVSNNTKCIDGRSLYELDPTYYESFC